MKLSAGFALIVLGFAGNAVAQPRPEEPTGRVSLNDVPAPQRDRAPWTELADPSPTKHGKMTLMVGKQAGHFTKLLLESTKGRVVIVRAKVVFETGKPKIFRLDKNLAKPGKFVDLDLGGQRLVDHVVVTTETYTRGKYALYGSSSSGPVAGR